VILRARPPRTESRDRRFQVAVDGGRAGLGGGPMTKLETLMRQQFEEAELWLSAQGGRVSRTQIADHREQVYVSLPTGHAAHFIVDDGDRKDFEQELVLAVEELSVKPASWR
jgi:hypothetical protein